jgi:hypothetical protein
MQLLPSTSDKNSAAYLLVVCVCTLLLSGLEAEVVGVTALVRVVIEVVAFFVVV